tara:strand:+ start:1842 stop:2417 length:576 start_codon:yes stop_codon:yes gene_type:complete
MALEISVGEKEVKAAGIDPEAPADLVVHIRGSIFSVKLNARKTLDNNIIIYDNRFFNIVLIPYKNKIVTMPKQHVNRDTYGMQNDFLTYLQNKGALTLGSIRSGSTFRSLEGFYPVNEEVDVLQVILLLSKAYIEKHGHDYTTLDDYLDDVEDMYVDPPADETTPYGKIPQDAEKGTVPATGRPYGLIYRI